MEEAEVWIGIEGYESFYQVSDLGRVKSLPRTYIRWDGATVNLKERILRAWDNGERYLVVDLHTNGVGKKCMVHKLVCDHFIRKCGENEMVNHKDKDRSNNRKNNIEIVSSRENNCHRVKGTKKYVELIGVSKMPNRKKPWTSQITINGKPKHLGYFHTPEEAYQARVDYEKDNNIQNRYL